MSKKIESIFVTGTDTGVGKTVISSLLMLTLGYTYWKPIQSGIEEETDTEFVKRVTQLPESRFLPEQYRLKKPRSPHESAEAEGKVLIPEEIHLPDTTNSMLVEGAGGLFVPITYSFMVIDLIKKLELPVVLVSRTSLGTLNHTLLSLLALEKYQIPVKGVILNGPIDKENEKTLRKLNKAKILGQINEMQEINVETLKKASSALDLTVFLS